MTQGAVDDAIEVLHQLERHLEGQAPTQGDDTTDSAPGDAVRKAVCIGDCPDYLFIDRILNLVVEKTPSL